MPSQRYLEIQRTMAGDDSKVGIRPEYGAKDKDLLPFFESSLLLAQQLRKRGHQVVFLFTAIRIDDVAAALDGFPAFELPLDEFVELDFIDVFFVMDDVAQVYTRFPERSKVVAFRHGLSPIAQANSDPFRYLECALESTAVDYVVRTNSNAQRIPTQDWLGVITDTFPPESHLRPSTTLGVIPGGYLKLDLYRQACVDRAAPPDALLFAPTSIQVDRTCKDFVERFGATIINTLLDVFPNHKVVFRPYPQDRETEVIQRVLEEFRDHERVEFDLSPHIKDVYARSAVLIGDMSNASNAFCFARLRPYVGCMFGAEGRESVSALGYSVHNLEQLAVAVAHALANVSDWEETLTNARSTLVSNAGETASYLAEHLDHILSDRPHADWAYIPKLSKPGQRWTIDDYAGCIARWYKARTLPRLLLGPALRVAKAGIRDYPDSAFLYALQAKILFNARATDEKVKYYDAEDDPMACMERAFRLNADVAKKVAWHPDQLVALIERLISNG